MVTEEFSRSNFAT
jgi:hypothetical protein